jgi:ketosteroid isomerase-like protein
MTDPTSTALDTTLAYFRAWTGGDFEQAISYIAPDIVCQAPAGTIRGVDAFRDFMGPFAGMLRSAQLLAGYGDDGTALIMYDASTALVTDAPGAELHTVIDGRISRIKIIFDRQPFTEARAAGTPIP